MASRSSYIAYAKRTPVGRFLGSLSSVPAPKLGATLLKDALSVTALDPEQIDEVILGQVLTAGCGQAPARQATLYGGLPSGVRATTINRVCGSGLKSIMLADQAIRLGDARLIFAGGQENMSLAPHFLPNSRTGFRFGSVGLLDHMQWDGLTDPYRQEVMGSCAELCAKKYALSREAQDLFARNSYEKARQAWDQGCFQDEVLPVFVQGKKETTVLGKDEEPFGPDLTKLAGLKPAFDAHGTITAGNASSISDGAAIVMVAAESALGSAAISPIARIVSQASWAGASEWFTTAPIGCIDVLLKKAHLNIADIDLWEINEAFSVVTMAAIEQLKLPKEAVNVHGGAVAIGHPIGASGARILVTLIHALKRRKLRYGLAVLCIGGGEASGVIVESI